MSDPQPFSQPEPAELSTPFDSKPTQPGGGGCARAGVIGCGVLTLVLGVGAILFLLKASDLFSWAMSQFEEQIVQALPEDCTEEERRRLEEAFAGVAAAVESGEFDPMALRRLQQKLGEAILDEDQRLTREQVLELTILLEEVAGLGADEEPIERETSPAPTAA